MVRNIYKNPTISIRLGGENWILFLYDWEHSKDVHPHYCYITVLKVLATSFNHISFTDLHSTVGLFNALFNNITLKNIHYFWHCISLLQKLRHLKYILSELKLDYLRLHVHFCFHCSITCKYLNFIGHGLLLNMFQY